MIQAFNTPGTLGFISNSIGIAKLKAIPIS